MNTMFYIADDDIAIQRILSKIIKENGLGEILGTAEDGVTAVNEIIKIKPDIVLIDLLMPGMDGIEAILALKEAGSESAFIMISQVDSEKMIARAYDEGIEFYISKPINVVEVVSVIKSVDKKQGMTKVIKSFESALKLMNVSVQMPADEKMELNESIVLNEKAIGAKTCEAKNNMKKTLAHLGISGEAGCQDIIEVVIWISSKDNMGGNVPHSYKLSNAYEHLIEKYDQEQGIKLNSGTLEQRIRRAIKSALKNLANLGIEDYYDDTFVQYSSTLFDFSEVRKEMDFERGKSSYNGKINVKKFIEGLLVIQND